MKKRKTNLLIRGKKSTTYSQTLKIKTETKGIISLKTLFIASLIAAQIAVLVYLNITFALAFQWVLIISFVFSVITCFYVLSSNKNSLSKAVWIIFILLFFTLGYIVYIISDERIFFRKAKKRYEKIYNNSKKYLLNEGVTIDNTAVKRDCNYLMSAGAFKTYSDTKMQYFSSGEEMFVDVIERLKSAREFIFIEFFIIADGSLLERIFKVLKEKVDNGVEVRVIYDDMGSHKPLSRKSKEMLKKAGIKLCPFNRLVPIFSIALNYRDHRKIIIVDGKSAYTGGCNLADEYVNEKRMYGYWKDAGLRLDGPAVDGFTLMFLRQWEYLVKKGEDYSTYLNKAEKYSSKSVMVPYADGLDFSLPIGKSVYENMISSAKEKIYIMTPYFIVDDTLNNLLANKAMSGVDVRIILPEIPNKKFVYGVTRNNAE